MADNTTIWDIKKALEKIEGHLSWMPTINENIGNIASALEKLAPPEKPIKVSTPQQPYRPKWGTHKINPKETK